MSQLHSPRYLQKCGGIFFIFLPLVLLVIFLFTATGAAVAQNPAPQEGEGSAETLSANAQKILDELDKAEEPIRQAREVNIVVKGVER